MAPARASRLSSARIVGELRSAARRGDRAALTLALDQMRTLALSPRYWEKYLALLRNPMARLVDLLVIKQGDRIAHQKGWKLPKGASKLQPARRKPAKPTRGRRRPPAAPGQQLLFEI